jgi:uncharacterized membrane protein
MNSLILVTVIFTSIGSALISGIFFAFSNFIMKAFSRLPSSEGMAAMKSINVVVLNPLFLGLFMGTAITSLIIVVIALMKWGTPSALYFLIGALLYIFGTFLVTGMGNVPLNNRLASIVVTDPAANDTWNHYLERWTHLNTIRTFSALLACATLIIGAMKL